MDWRADVTIAPRAYDVIDSLLQSLGQTERFTLPLVSRRKMYFPSEIMADIVLPPR